MLIINANFSILQKCRFQRATLIGASGCFKFLSSKDYVLTRPDNSEIAAKEKSLRNGTHVLKIEFTSLTEQSFRQDVLLDFGVKPYLIKTLRIEIGNSEEMNLIKEFHQQMKNQSDQWTFDDKHLCQDYIDRRIDEEGFETKHLRPQGKQLMSRIHKALDEPLSTNNYHSRFHTLLFVEEIARVTALSGYVCAMHVFVCMCACFLLYGCFVLFLCLCESAPRGSVLKGVFLL